MAGDTRGAIAAEEFVSIWQSSNSVAEVIKRTKSTRVNVCARASNFRSKGIPLKYMPSTLSVDWDKLKTLAKTLTEGNDNVNS